MRPAFSLAFVLSGVWLLWSGHYTTMLLGLGAASVLGVVLLFARMGLLDEESTPASVAPRALVYAPWLLLQIVKANVDVARRVLTPGLPIQPSLIKVQASQRSDLGRVIYANSITLTPGTVTVEVEADHFTVHALSREAAEGLAAGDMDRRVSRVERR